MVRGAGSRLYLDSNVLIYFLDEESGWADAARQLLEYGQSGQVSLITGDAVVAEVLVGALRSSEASVIESTRRLLDADFIASAAHDRDSFLAAAAIRASVGGHLIDALHVATAIAAGCDAVISHDARMPRLPEMPVLRLDEFSLTP